MQKVFLKPGTPQRHGPTDFFKDEQKFQVFLARVLTVDYERKVCTIEDARTGLPYSDVEVFPANASSFESSDVQMPEPGSTCLAVPLIHNGGYSKVAIISYVLQDTVRKLDAIATRPLEKTPGYNQRKRGTYRKAYPGQKAATFSGGYTEKVDDGWDRTSRDFSRDRLDSNRREWTQITSRRVTYTDAGLIFEGPINRPDAEDIEPRIMPDGSKQYVLYLQPGVTVKDRYFDGEADVIAFSERTERVQEFALDFPVPQEVLSSDLLDEILGTHASPWDRTAVKKTGNVSHDDQSYSIDQNWDSPYGKPERPVVGPSTNEGSTPKRRGFILERTEGTLVGFNRWDKDTYGKILKPTLFAMDGINGEKLSRFSASTATGYAEVKDDKNHVESRLAASCYSIRFPHEWNTTRWDVTKEGFISMEIGSTLPVEKIQKYWPGSTYEHPHGAGRSLEAHFVGSVKAVLGKNRDEEESLDVMTAGQVVLRLGADDASLPTQSRVAKAQNRGALDTMQPRDLQYWDGSNASKGLHKVGDCVSLTNKKAGENISLRGATDGGVMLRFGARDINSKRRHFVNGYKDGQGRNRYDFNDPSRIDAKHPGRHTYIPPDTVDASNKPDDIYAFHNMNEVGKPYSERLPYFWSGDPVQDMDKHGLSADLHFCRDVLLRIGKNDQSNQSLLVDLDGGMVLAIGKDKQGRSITVSADGGAEIVIGKPKDSRGLQLEIHGDVNMYVDGNMHQHVAGDYILECNNFRQITKQNWITSAQNIVSSALNRHTVEAPDMIHNQGLYKSNELSEPDKD